MSLQRITCSDTGSSLVHTCDPCNKELGRVRGVVLFKGDYDIATLIAKLKLGTSEGTTEAVTLFETAITAGNAFLISETNGTFDGGAAQTGDGYGDEENRLLGYLYTLAFKDPSYKDNVDFWQKAEKEHWIMCWRTETLLHFADKPASIQAIDPVEEDLTSAVAWNVTATWKSQNKAQVAPYEPIAKYFEGCWQASSSNS